MTTITYDSVVLVNPSITSYKKNGGGASWSLSCIATNIASVEAIMAYASPASENYDITGQKYVISAKSPKVLIIDSVSYSKCYVNSVTCDPFAITRGESTYDYKVDIVQAAI